MAVALCGDRELFINQEKKETEGVEAEMVLTNDLTGKGLC
jgi:hypothetical protein